MDRIELTSAELHLLTSDQAWHYRVLPKGLSGNSLTLYAEALPGSDGLKNELEVVLGKDIELVLLPEADISKLLNTYYIRGQSGQDGLRAGGGGDASTFLNRLIQESHGLKSSDIHIESYEHKCRVRVRIDGSMVERYLLKKEDYPELINRIKITANLDISEKRLPQDGRISFRIEDKQFDIRVSVLPTQYGEKVVLRLLSNDAGDVSLEGLGFSARELLAYRQGIRQPSGILLISGPTGSGKTTTLYATLKELNKATRNILTVEDPVEYTLEGINQVQLKESIGLGFPAALRTFLRQDPDVIMVGEIRDVETANMAIRAALTGHLVLSTIHTNSAWGIVSRLIDMGVPAFLLASTLNTTVAQRLVKLLCAHCKVEQDIASAVYPAQFEPYRKLDRHFIPGGCDRCHFTGYRGRRAVYEVIPVDSELAREIKDQNMDVRQHLAIRGISTLAENAFNLFEKGETSLDEIFPLLLHY
jgi:type IV pilus assembly protein PilB